MSDPWPPRQPGPDGGVDQALAGVLEAVSAASLALALRKAMSMACQGDRQGLAACLEALTPDQLLEVAAAARLLSAAAGQALSEKPADHAPGGL
ncbi:hypothetical protein AB0K12_46820 [Nonomuraea sp. NPDC049419]|uniref:hypothetical protein n=1 Tax=Nonomuraea sp. NPDC049419 TaxID=3155772 RepID=UPI00343B60A9